MTETTQFPFNTISEFLQAAGVDPSEEAEWFFEELKKNWDLYVALD